MSASENAASIPLGFVFVTTVATLFMGGGATGLFAPDLAPPLARPAVVWLLISVGIVLDIGALMQLLSSRK